MNLRHLITTFILLACSAGPVAAQAFGSGSQALVPFKSIVAKANDSTVRIRCDDKDTVLGTVVYAEGYILTKASELRGRLSVRIPDGGEYDAEIVGIHKPTDLALLKVEADDLKPVVLADSKKVPSGSWLAAAGPAGTPLGAGIVSVRTRPLTGPDASFTLNANRGFLGITLSESSEDSGAKITGVEKGGAAAKAGLLKSDTILELNGKPIPDQQTLREMLAEYRPGDEIKLKIKRGEEQLNKKAKLTGPIGGPSRGDIQNAMGGELSGRRTGFPAVLQTDMVVEPKNCGGPVVDLDGNVLGISIARAGRVESWILPSENIRPLLADLKSGKFAPTSAAKKTEK